MVCEISVEQTNRIRAALGLRLIPVAEPEPVRKKSTWTPGAVSSSVAAGPTRDSVEPAVPTRAKPECQPSDTISWLLRMKRHEAAAAPAQDTSAQTTRGIQGTTGTADADLDAGPGAGSGAGSGLVVDTGTSGPADDADSAQANAADAQTETNGPASVGLDTAPSAAPVAEPVADSTAGSVPDLSRDSSHGSASKVKDAPSSVSCHPDYKPPVFKKRKQKSQKRRRLDHDYVLAPVAPVDPMYELDLALDRSRKRKQMAKPQIHVIGSGSMGSRVTLSDSAAFLETIKRQTNGQGEDTVDIVDTADLVGQGPVDAVDTSGTVDSADPERPPISNTIADPAGPAGPAGPTTAPAMTIAATLNMLQGQGVVRDTEQDRQDRDWRRTVAAERLARTTALEEQERSLRNAGQRAAHERHTLKEDTQIALRQFKGYNPSVKVVHKDANGNIVSAKQAWKDLSSTFHGTKKRNPAPTKRPN